MILNAGKQQLEVYVHFPFCQKKCDFCFYTSFDSYHSDTYDQYVDRLVCEIHAEEYQELLSAAQINSIYLGGGTPTLLPVRQLVRVINELAKVASLSPAVEINIELHPSSVNEDYIKELLTTGITRFSMGIQSLDERVLKAIGREQSPEMTLKHYALLRESGIENINIDLIYGLPEQTLESYIDSLEKILALSPGHITVYPFTARLTSRIFTDGNFDFNNQLRRQMWLYTKEAMRRNGYLQTSVPYFVKERRFELVHDRNLWAGHNTLGLGCSAFSYLEGTISQNICDLPAYLESEGVPGKHLTMELSKGDDMKRFILLALTKLLYFDPAKFQAQYSQDALEIFADQFASLLESGYIAQEGDGRFVLTEYGEDNINKIPFEFFPFDSERYMGMVLS